jgi:hypothetical protein
MSARTNKKIFTGLMSIICAILIVTPICNAELKNINLSSFEKSKLSERQEGIQNFKPTMGGTEFWALLVAVGEYENHPQQNRPSMLEAVDNLYDVLLDSPLWQKDHIHVLKAKDATLRNLIKELIWLIIKDDRNDMSLIYITTHGTPAQDKDGNPVDIFPKDEDDNADEVLIMYRGFDKWQDIIWDDLLNFFLRLMQSKGICLIIDSCYAGGFNDQYNPIKSNEMSSLIFTRDFIEEIGSKRKVVLMSCEEDSVSYGSIFSNFIINGFKGSADSNGNGDGVNSAEEAFYYAEPIVRFMSYGEQCPTMLDLYSGEFLVTFT